MGGGKDKNLYVVNRDNMGGFNAVDNSQIVQSIPLISTGIWGKPVYWQNTVYLSDWTYLMIFPLSNGLLPTTPVKIRHGFGYPGAIPAISSNGSSGGVLWMVQPSAAGECLVKGGKAAILHAYDPTSVSELYNSTQAGNRDSAGPATNFIVPTIANGKVYVATQTELDVYGLFPN